MFTNKDCKGIKRGEEEEEGLEGGRGGARGNRRQIKKLGWRKRDTTVLKAIFANINRIES